VVDFSRVLSTEEPVLSTEYSAPCAIFLPLTTHDPPLAIKPRGDRTMKFTTLCWITFAAWAINFPTLANAQEKGELKVHLAQANNNSPYAFVRAKFKPGEVADPWAVRFFDDKGTEIPYFVWDSVTWRVAQAGRADWGQRYALINHAPGDVPEVVQARAQKLQWTKKNLPELGAKLEAHELAAKRAPDSVCAAMYLLRKRVPAFGKERLTLRIYQDRQVNPTDTAWKQKEVGKRISAQQGELVFRDLPDRLGVVWKGKEIFRSAGFHAGDWADPSSHADPARPFRVYTSEGIITKVSIAAQTKGRQGGSMDWQCTYWLFPEGSYVALQGFSLSDTTGYAGGPQKLSAWQADGNFTERRAPLWETPWWLHQAGDRGFVATHLFNDTPLTIGFGNNPFAVNAEGAGKDPKVLADGNRLTLSWSHRIDDPAIMRVMAPQPLRRPSDPPPPQPKPLRWQPNVDWLYRQYAAGIGQNAEAAEGSLRAVLSAAAGWIDRPFSEEEIAALLVKMMPRIATGRESSEIGLLKIVPAALSNDQTAVKAALGRAKDQVARTDYYINLIRRHVELGGRPSEGKKKDDKDGTPREGWTGNPCYHAALMPCYVRVLEHFDLPFPQKAYREAIVRYADFSLEILGGKPTDFDKLNATFQTEWPSRIVPIIPLMLHANTLKPDAEYVRASKVLFEDLMRLVERNPHGYFPVWTFNPKADRYDTVYNPVSYERGITSLWSEEQLDVVGRGQASRFVAAQARWFVFSGQLLDTLETDNATAIRASTHGGHTGIRNQIGIYLYDDFDFYRGLVGDLVAWSAASCQVPGRVDDYGTGAYRSLELSNGGSSMLRWALDIRPGSKWLESKVQRIGKNGFRLQAWNRVPQAKPTIKLAAQDVGLAKGELAEVLQVQLSGPAFRQPAEFDVTWTADTLSLKVNKPAKIRLSYRVLRPAWPAQRKLVLEQRRPGGLAEAVRSDVVWENDRVEWRASPGEYDLRPASK
jgi:hypothetical protein